MLNARASFNRLVGEKKDAAATAVFEPDQQWPTPPAIKVEWLSAEVPRSLNTFARNVLVRFRGESTYDVEAMAGRFVKAIGLGNNQTLCLQPEYDYAAQPNNPPRSGTFTIERSPRGVDVVPPPDGNSTIRELVLYLVVVYRQS